MILSICFLVPRPAQWPPVLLKTWEPESVPTMCVYMCVCPVHQTRLCSTFSFQKVSPKRTFLAASGYFFCCYIFAPLHVSVNAPVIRSQRVKHGFCSTPRKAVALGVILSVCFSVSCLKEADRERGRAFQHHEAAKVTCLQGALRNVHLTTLTASCYYCRFTVLCNIYASKHWWIFFLCVSVPSASPCAVRK